MDDLKFERIQEVINQKIEFNKNSESGYGISVCSVIPGKMQFGIYQMGYIASRHMEYLAVANSDFLTYKGMAAGYFALENIVDTSGIFLSYMNRIPSNMGIEETDISEYTLSGYSRNVADILEEFNLYMSENFSTASTVLESVKDSKPNLYDITKSLTDERSDKFLSELDKIDFPQILRPDLAEIMYQHLFTTLATIYEAAETFPNLEGNA